MSLKDEVVALPRRRKIDRIIAELGDEGQELIELLNDSEHYSADAITRALNKRGIDISCYSIKRWRLDHGVAGFRG